MTRLIRPGEVAALREQLRGWLVSPVNYARLVALKAKFDPTNFFRCNHNIYPW